jgi:UDP-3-O-[3-hydroxymyristoyl] glucosamine N-acyltransferase
MADPRFFAKRGPHRLGHLAEICGAALAKGADPEMMIEDVAPLDTAGAAEISFLDNVRYLGAFRQTRAGACIVAPEHAVKAPAATRLLLSAEPYKAYARVAQAFYPRPTARPGVHPTAVVAASARLAKGVEIGPGAVIDEGVSVGPRTAIGAKAVIAAHVEIGTDCEIGPLASLSHCRVGNRVTIQPGACIGQAGFGFAPDPSGHVPVPQLGRVLIGDDCRIGANTTIDRGSGPDTVIGAGTWIDNLVQIGHNVCLGERCIVVAQVGISGSTRLGNFVALGGQAGLTGHLKIGDGAQIAAQAGVMNDVPAGQTVFGSPAGPIKEVFRQIAMVRRMAREGSKGDD